jgi:hypothetical protein
MRSLALVILVALHFSSLAPAQGNPQVGHAEDDEAAIRRKRSSEMEIKLPFSHQSGTIRFILSGPLRSRHFGYSAFRGD